MSGIQRILRVVGLGVGWLLVVVMVVAVWWGVTSFRDDDDRVAPTPFPTQIVRATSDVPTATSTPSTLVLVWATAVPATESAVSIYRYEDPEHGYSFSYPSDWDLARSLNEAYVEMGSYARGKLYRQVAAIATADGVPSDSVRIVVLLKDRMGIVFRRLIGPFEEFDALPELVASGITSLGNNILQSFTQVTIANHPAYEVEYLNVYSNPDTDGVAVTHHLDLFLQAGDSVFVVESHSSERVWAQQEDELRAIMNSFDPRMEPHSEESADECPDVMVSAVGGTRSGFGWLFLTGSVTNTCDRGVFVATEAHTFGDDGEIYPLYPYEGATFEIIGEYSVPYLYLGPHETEEVTMYTPFLESGEVSYVDLKARVVGNNP